MLHDVDELFNNIRKHLLDASDEGILASSVSDILALLRKDKDKKAHPKGEASILGGPTNFKRDPQSPAFERDDGARFDFAITVRWETCELKLLAYHFEIRFPEGSPGFVRFDLNTPGHPNEDLGIRSHIHPGHDDLQVPAPLMHPIEVLDVLVYGLRRREGRKART